MATLIDTNVLVYARGVDGDATRQRQAILALKACRADGFLTVQVLQEFASVLIRKRLSIDVIYEDVATLQRTWSVVASNNDTVLMALECVKAHHMSFWDALLWATARQHDITTILTEDGPTGADVGGIYYRSPFSLAERE